MAISIQDINDIQRKVEKLNGLTATAAALTLFNVAASLFAGKLYMELTNLELTREDHVRMKSIM